MIEFPTDLPGRDTNSTDVVADWIELCLVADCERLSWDDIKTVCRDAGLYDDQDDQLALNYTWIELKRRKILLGERYPLAVHNMALERIGDLQSYPSFAFLLLVATAGHYGPWEVSEMPRLFEHVVTAAVTGLLNGRAARFGWPPDNSRTPGVRERIKCFAQEMGLEPEHLDNKVESHDKDIGLDVAVRHGLGGSDAGSVVFLIQCATGKNWAEKNAVPLKTWEKLIQWNARPVPAFAVPWWWGKDGEYTRYSRRMDYAVMLDRARLLKGGPDGYLAANHRAEVMKWSHTQLMALPRL